MTFYKYKLNFVLCFYIIVLIKIKYLRIMLLIFYDILKFFIFTYRYKIDTSYKLKKPCLSIEKVNIYNKK